MADLPITLVVGASNPSIDPLLSLSQEMTLLFAQSADEVIELTSDNEAIDLCVVSAVDTGQAKDLCAWLKTDSEMKSLPMVVLGSGNMEPPQYWLRAGAIDFLDYDTDPQLLAVRLKSYAELKHKNDLLSQIASLDSLTSLPDRRRLDEYLDIEWRRSLREYYPLSLIKLDLDLFGAFNQEYGLGRGDEVLRRVARALEASFNRAADMLSRYDGDEFVALLPSLELDSALILAEKMVDVVSGLGFENSAADGGILTASAGVATIEPSRDKRFQDLLDETAEMLSRAQQAGGDQAQGIAI